MFKTRLYRVRSYTLSQRRFGLLMGLTVFLPDDDLDTGLEVDVQPVSDISTSMIPMADSSLATTLSALVATAPYLPVTAPPRFVEPTPFDMYDWDPSKYVQPWDVDYKVELGRLV